MSVVAFPARRTNLASQLLVVFVDLQREYASKGRAFEIEHLGDCLPACSDLLRASRERRLTIAHFRQLRPEPCFNAASPFSDWLDGFRPRASEAVFDRALPSIYANPDFGAYVSSMSSPTILMAGLSADRACLASAVEAFHRGHRLIFVEDCSACAEIAGLPEVRSHAFATEIISRFAEVSRSADLIDWFEQPHGGVRKRVT